MKTDPANVYEEEVDPSIASQSRPVSDMQDPKGTVRSVSDTTSTHITGNDYPHEKDNGVETAANDPESSIPLETPGTVVAPEYTFPDKGLRAWSVVAGVSAFGLQTTCINF